MDVAPVAGPDDGHVGMLGSLVPDGVGDCAQNFRLSRLWSE